MKCPIYGGNFSCGPCGRSCFQCSRVPKRQTDGEQVMTKTERKKRIKELEEQLASEKQLLAEQAAKPAPKESEGGQWNGEYPLLGSHHSYRGRGW